MEKTQRLQHFKAALNFEYHKNILEWEAKNKDVLILSY